MNLIESTIALLAPHCCLICRTEGLPVCDHCASDHFPRFPSICYRCTSPVIDFAICSRCSVNSSLLHLWIATKYAATPKDTVALIKFQRVSAAAIVIAGRLDATIPILSPDTLVCPAPTANARVRARGYDQACLIARAFARRRQLQYAELLLRVSTARQVGASRRDRLHQARHAFRLIKPGQIRGRSILLIDDVLTTGATLESAAKVIYDNGASYVNAAVFAH